ncbi:MAG: hypothetical protein QM680_06380 [Luteolibacter sp.]
MTINRNNALKVASVGGFIYWMVILLAFVGDIVTNADSKSGFIRPAMIFMTFIGAGFYSMLLATFLKPIKEKQPLKEWSEFDMLIGLSPVPIILFSAVSMVEKIVSEGVDFSIYRF